MGKESILTSSAQSRHVACNDQVSKTERETEEKIVVGT